jgi:regulator of protease activity HflC (stomatin/prohibitin superfamily)
MKKSYEGLDGFAREMTDNGKRIAFFVGLFFVGLIIFNNVVFIVPAGYAGVIFSGLEGGIKQVTYTEGWHIKLPIVETADFVEVRIRKYTGDAASASRDLQDVQTKVALNYYPDKSKVHVLYQTVGMEYENRIINPAIEESIKAITARYTAEEMITKRGEVSAEMREALVLRLSQYDLIVTDFSIVDFRFSQGFTNAIESKQVAEQEAQREMRVLDRVRIQAEQKIATAEGDRQSMILRAEGEAKAKIMTAEAEAKAIEMQAKALKENPDIISLRYIEKWNGQVPKVQLAQDSMALIDISKEI